MGIQVTTDSDLDRAIALRLSHGAPMPPELSLCQSKDAKAYFDWLTPFHLMGLDEHVFVKKMGSCKIRSAMATAIAGSAPFEDRLAMYLADCDTSEDPVLFIDGRSAVDADTVPNVCTRSASRSPKDAGRSIERPDAAEVPTGGTETPSRAGVGVTPASPDPNLRPPPGTRWADSRKCRNP